MLVLLPGQEGSGIGGFNISTLNFASVHSRFTLVVHAVGRGSREKCTVMLLYVILMTRYR